VAILKIMIQVQNTVGSIFIDTFYTDSFEDAVNSIGTAPAVIQVIGNCTLNKNLTVPSNITLDFTELGSVFVSTGYTLTIAGPLVSTARQTFTGPGTVILPTVTLTAGFTLATPYNNLVNVTSAGNVISSTVTAISSGFYLGQEFTLFNVGSYTVTLKNAANTDFGSDQAMSSGTTLGLIWSSSGWLITSSQGMGSGVTQITAGTAIGVSPSGGTGNVTVNNDGVTSLIAGTGISISGSTGNITVTNTQSGLPAGFGTYVSNSPNNPVNLTNGLPTNIASLSLGVGDWEVQGNVATGNVSGNSFTFLIGAVSTTSGGFDSANVTTGEGYFELPFNEAASNTIACSTGMRRIVVASGTTTVYLVVDAGFSTGSPTASGIIKARNWATL